MQRFLQKWQLGDEFGKRFLGWWKSLRWVPGSVPISALELYINYCIETKGMVPHQIRGKGSPFLLRDQHIEADLCKAVLSLQNKTWIRAIRFLRDHFAECFLPGWIDRYNSLGVFGYTIKVITMGCRPILPQGIEAGRILWSYFHTDNGVIRDLKREWKVHTCCISAAGF